MFLETKLRLYIPELLYSFNVKEIKFSKILIEYKSIHNTRSNQITDVTDIKSWNT